MEWNNCLLLRRLEVETISNEYTLHYNRLVPAVGVICMSKNIHSLFLLKNHGNHNLNLALSYTFMEYNSEV